MNQLPESQHSGVAAFGCQIDRLVDGELPDWERSALLRRLETEPDGWRHCALAFLEAQSWREALAPVAAVGPAEPAPRVVRRRQMPQRWRYAACVTGLAASLMATFILGWTLHVSPTPTPVDNHLSAQDNNDRPATPTESQQPELYAQAQPEALAYHPDGQPVALDPVIKEWERQGYQAETQTRLASLKMKDGRNVEIPVHEVRLHYVRDRTY